MKLSYTLFVLSFCVQCNIISIKASIEISDIFSSTGTIVKGIGKEVINVIPTPEELFKTSKQVLFGLPEIVVFKTIHELCSLYMASETIKPHITPETESMTLVLNTPCKILSFPLTHAEKILESSEFDVNKNVVIFVTGWMASSDDDYVAEMANAFHCRGGYNYLALNTSGSIDSLYTWSAYNNDEVGRLLAIALEKFVKRVPVEKIHLIGHSLGAHIVGHAGRYFNKYTGLNITRITGLDPANPCFNEGQVLSGLQRGDAEFVNIIHSNPGVLGKSDPLDDVDFYPEGLAPIKPGCYKFGCSHGRAYEYFTETVYPGNEHNFLAVRCTSLTGLNNGFCNGTKFPMGFAVPHNLKGNYFLNVNSAKSYGQNFKNHNTISQNCGKCVIGK